jgi:flavin reductase (DIM6/NTAB) family NADH-FMN oxidoreductase RutF
VTKVAIDPAALDARSVYRPFTLVVGQVVYFHVRQDPLLPGHRIDAAALRAVGRMAGNGYTRTHELFELESFLRV